MMGAEIQPLRTRSTMSSPYLGGGRTRDTAGAGGGPSSLPPPELERRDPPEEVRGPEEEARGPEVEAWGLLGGGALPVVVGGVGWGGQRAGRAGVRKGTEARGNSPGWPRHVQ